MSYRFMRMLLFFDLPTVEIEDRREYMQFRKFLIRSGFMMLQESVYCKLLLNATAANAVMASVHKNKPTKGLIQTLIITEKQFARMEYVIGKHQSEMIDSVERLIEL